MLPKLEMITEGTILFNGVVKPVLEVKVINGYYSDPENLKFTWNVKEMTKRHLIIDIIFEKALFVSTEEEKDKLRVTFRDRYLFVSVNDMAIVDPNKNESRRRNL